MHYLLYAIGVCSAIVGAFWGQSTENLSIISSGVMAAVLFGSIGRIVHLLVQIEQHLRPKE